MPIFTDRLYCTVMRQRAQRRTKSSRKHTNPNRPLVLRLQGFRIPTLAMHGRTFLCRPTYSEGLSSLASCNLPRGTSQSQTWEGSRGLRPARFLVTDLWTLTRLIHALRLSGHHE